jgi:hypothetical protein
LARYGIVITADELAALYPSMAENSAAPSNRTKTPLRTAKSPWRRVRRRSSETAVSRHRKTVQLPLFPSADCTATSSLAVR